MDWKKILGTAWSDELEKSLNKAVEKNYVARADFSEVNEAKNQLEKDLAARDAQLEELKKVDAEGLKAEIERLQGENKTASENYQTQLDELKYETAVKEFASGIKFTSELAKNAFIADFKSKGFKHGKEGFLGADDYVKQVKKDNPAAFSDDAGKSGGTGFGSAKPIDQAGGSENFMNDLIRGTRGE